MRPCRAPEASYPYLLECYGRSSWGRLMAFLFIWLFLLSGPLELASGLIAVDTFSQSLSPAWSAFNEANQWHFEWKAQKLAVTFSPTRLGCVGLGVLIIALLYNRVTILGRLTLGLCLIVLGLIGWIVVEGMMHFDRSVAFSPWPRQAPGEFALGLGKTMALALYSYLGYYNICWLGDEVRDPGRTIPRAVLISAALVVVLFILVHLALMGTVAWNDVPKTDDELANFSLPATFMRKIYGEGTWTAAAVTVCLIVSCFAAAFAGLLGYSRIPYGAARSGHFFALVGAVHPRHNIPHVSLLLVGGMMLFLSFFDLETVISALIVTRILGQFVAQVIGVMLLRSLQPDLPRPFRIWLYPLPCLLALAGWLFVCFTSETKFIVLGLATLAVGIVVFALWSFLQRSWPFA